MSEPSTVVERTEALVVGHLQELGVEYRQADNGVIAVAAGSTAVYISAAEFRDRGVVHLVAPVLEGVPGDAPGLAELPGLNSRLLFGRFSYDADATRITVEYDLFGDTLDEEELRMGLSAVGHIADEWDERLQQTLGGRRPLVDES